MEITILGYFALMLTLVFCIFRNKKLFLYASIFFSGFSGSSVLNIFGGSIQISFYFFFIYFVALLFSPVKHRWRLGKAVLIFLSYCIISLFFPFFMRGFVIMNQNGIYAENSFSFSNIIQIAYLLFNILYINELMRYENDTKTQQALYKSYKWGFFAVIVVCIYQLLAFRLNLSFDELFRQNVHGNVQGTRLYGPCIEASMLCYYLLPSMVLVFMNRKGLFDWFLIYAALFLGLLTSSSTFLIGLFLCAVGLIIYVVVDFRTGKLKFSDRKLVGFTLCFIALVIVFMPKMESTVNALIGKLTLQTVSGIERLSAFRNMARIGLLSPIGVGWGSGRSKDLFSTWCCNIGIVGLALFFWIIYRYLRRSKRSGRIWESCPFVILLILMFVSVPEPYNLFIWYLAFYGIACKNSICVKNKSMLLQSKDRAPYQHKSADIYN